jgi:hypothetical protein
MRNIPIVLRKQGVIPNGDDLYSILKIVQLRGLCLAGYSLAPLQGKGYIILFMLCKTDTWASWMEQVEIVKAIKRLLIN